MLLFIKVTNIATYVEKHFVMIKKQKKRFKLYKKVRHHCYFTRKFRGAAHCLCNLHYKVPQEIPVKFHIFFKFLKGEFECLVENTEKYISFSVPIKKECDNNSGETITHKIKFIDSCRFMSSK